MSTFFRQERLKSAFTFQDVYMGLSPFEAPATFSMMPYTELAHGVWYPNGGMYSVISAVTSIAERAGVEFVYSTSVDRIEVNGTRARAVAAEDGRRWECEAILANADLPYVYRDLLPPSREAVNLAHKKYSCSVISFFWGVDREYKTLGPHTLFLVDDYRQNFEAITRDLAVPANPSIYIHAPARVDPSMSPPGQDTLIAIVPVGHLDENREGDWKELISQARTSVFGKLAILGIDDLPEHIKFEMCYTPLSWNKRYNLLKGSTHGLSHNLMQLAYFRPANRHARYHNLYFAGASTRPGTGMPTALISARLAAERMIQDLA
jgi:phytoene desaturase